MSTVALIEINLNNMTSNHKLYSTEKSSNLAVIFPGGNNSCDRPILHYLRKYFLSHNYDVLCISYSNLFERKDSSDIKFEKIVESVNSAIKQVEKEKQYVDRLFISRSAGNLAASELKIRHSINVKKSIYISPTSEAIKYISKYPGIIITASNDEYLENGDINKLRQLKQSELIVFKNGTHNLETANITETINFHKLVLIKIVDFVEKQ